MKFVCFFVSLRFKYNDVFSLFFKKIIFLSAQTIQVVFENAYMLLSDTPKCFSDQFESCS